MDRPTLKEWIRFRRGEIPFLCDRGIPFAKDIKLQHKYAHGPYDIYETMKSSTLSILYPILIKYISKDLHAIIYGYYRKVSRKMPHIKDKNAKMGYRIINSYESHLFGQKMIWYSPHRSHEPAKIKYMLTINDKPLFQFADKNGRTYVTFWFMYNDKDVPFTTKLDIELDRFRMFKMNAMDKILTIETEFGSLVADFNTGKVSWITKPETI